MDSSQDKSIVRAHFLELRAGIPEQERRSIDAGIAARVLELPAFQMADAVFTYLDMGDEVRTRSIIQAAWDAGKTVALPRCIPGTRQMAWHRTRSFKDLVKSRFGIDEPPDDPATRIVPASFGTPIALVPGATFDRGGYRIGYGGGYYDVFLAAFPGTTVGLCRECQLSERLTCLDAHDVAVQAVVTERRAWFTA
jgi:5-formyltetrahydrofolate cyclo-ligase